MFLGRRDLSSGVATARGRELLKRTGLGEQEVHGTGVTGEQRTIVIGYRRKEELLRMWRKQNINRCVFQSQKMARNVTDISHEFHITVPFRAEKVRRKF
jgi:hypothetical protein